MRKFHDYFIIDILREINLEDSWSAKLALLPHLEALKFDFCEFLQFLKVEIYHSNKIQGPLNLQKPQFLNF